MHQRESMEGASESMGGEADTGQRAESTDYDTDAVVVDVC